jgi:predicted HicB family RNase H-like nuclease
MDELDPLEAVRKMWSGANATPAKAKANRRRIEKAANKSSDYWTGRSAQLNIRMTPEIKADVQASAAEFGMSMAEFFETAVLELIAKKRGKP